MKSQLLILLRIFCMQWISNSPFVLVFQQFVYNVSRWISEFVDCLGCSDCFSWNLGHFWPLRLHIFFPSFLSSPSVTPIACMFLCLMMFHGFLLIFIHSLCFLFLILEISIDLSSCSLVLSFTTSNLLNSSNEFSFQLLYFSTTGFLFGSF